MTAEVPNPRELQRTAIKVLTQRDGRDFSPEGKVDASIIALRNVGVGIPALGTTVAITGKIDELFMNYMHISPDPGLTVEFQRRGEKLALEADRALGRLSTGVFRGNVYSEHSESHILDLLDRVPHEATQLVVAGQVTSGRERISDKAKKLLLRQVHSHERQIYPSTLVYLLQNPNIDIQKMAWSILEGDNTTGYDLQTGQVPDSIKQKILEMYDGGGQHRASVITSLLHERTEGKEGENLRDLAIERLVEELDRRTDWLRENFHAIASAGKSASADSAFTGPLPYLASTRRSLERLVGSNDKEESEIVKIGQRSLEHHAIQWQRLDQALPSWMSVQDSLAEIPTMTQSVDRDKLNM